MKYRDLLVIPQSYKQRNPNLFKFEPKGEASFHFHQNWPKIHTTSSDVHNSDDTYNSEKNWSSPFEN
jgi:hypothetical protein